MAQFTCFFQRKELVLLPPTYSAAEQFKDGETVRKICFRGHQLVQPANVKTHNLPLLVCDTVGATPVEEMAARITQWSSLQRFRQTASTVSAVLFIIPQLVSIYLTLTMCQARPLQCSGGLAERHRGKQLISCLNASWPEERCVTVIGEALRKELAPQAEGLLQQHVY